MLTAQILVLNALTGVDNQPTQVTLQISITESDTTLPLRNVSGTLDWGDGTAPLVILPAASPITRNVTHGYAGGSFLVKLTAQNYRNPTPDTFVSSLQLQLGNATLSVNQSPVLLGPILPADVGFPNQEQWNFDMSTDLKVLASNIKMILVVEPGERLMMPDFGCALRQFLFEPMDGLEQDVETEVRRAINTWEPRVLVDTISSTVDTTTRKIVLIVNVVSRLNQERFQLNVELQR